MALPPPLDPRPTSEPFSHPPGAPRELDAAGYAICPASGKERIRLEQAQKLGQDPLDPPEPFQGGLRGTEPTPASHEDSAGAKRHERPISGWEVLEAEQDSLHLCLLGLGLLLQDLERGLAPWASTRRGMVQLQTLQADLRGTAEHLDALLVFGEGLVQRSEPQAQASLEQVLRAFRAHRDSIFRQLWRLQAQLVSYSLVYEEASTLEQDLEVEGDSDGPGPGGVWGPWAPSSLPTPAELEWDPAGDVGGLGPLGRRTAWTPGAPCELCGHRGPQGRGQWLEDMLRSGLSHRKHFAGHRRRSLLQKSRALLLQGRFLLNPSTHFPWAYPPLEERLPLTYWQPTRSKIRGLTCASPTWVTVPPEPATEAKLMEGSDWPDLGHMPHQGRRVVRSGECAGQDETSIS